MKSYTHVMMRYPSEAQQNNNKIMSTNTRPANNQEDFGIKIYIKQKFFFSSAFFPFY